jgi:GGDEF domain-containing protein
MDPTSNRFKGIKYGADYYIKKPFDPTELRNLVTLFLKKKGKKFDPLIDLPNEDRISKELELLIKAGERYTIGKLKIENFRAFAQKFGNRSAMVMLRLISQLLQDSINGKERKEFVGFLNSDEFVVAGKRESVKESVDAVRKEFNAVLPFILQDEGFKYIDLNLDNLFESKDIPRPELKFTEVEIDEVLKRREEILKTKKVRKEGGIGLYTYDELKQMFGAEDALDIHITRESGGIKLHVSSDKEEEE